MRYLIIALLLLTGCGESALEKEVREEITNENLKKGTEYANSIYGTCFKSWHGTIYIVEKATEFYKDNNGTQLCVLNTAADYLDKSKTVINKVCAEFIRNDYLKKEKIDKMKPTTCPGTKNRKAIQ